MSTGRTPSPLHLGPVPEASSHARQYVRETLTALGASAVMDAAELAVSELVTNACLHAQTDITVSVCVAASGQVRIEVGDDSQAQPEERLLDTMTTNGRGLRLLSAYGVWGIAHPADGRVGKTVWFEPARADNYG